MLLPLHVPVKISNQSSFDCESKSMADGESSTPRAEVGEKWSVTVLTEKQQQSPFLFQIVISHQGRQEAFFFPARNVHRVRTIWVEGTDEGTNVPEN